MARIQKKILLKLKEKCNILHKIENAFREEIKIVYNRNWFMTYICLAASLQLLLMRVLYRVLSSASNFKFQYCVSSLNLFSNCLRFFFVSSSLLSFLQYPIINPVFICYVIHRVFLLPSLYEILLCFSHDPSKWSALSFPSTILKKLSNYF